MAMDAQEIDVLVVGAGPAGLTAAATLRRYGAEVLVIERKSRLTSHPRATVVSTRSMELLRSWGLEDEILAGGTDVEWQALVTRTLAEADRGEAAPLGLPTREQAAVLSPVAPLCAPQDHTEAVLLGYARSLGVEVRFAHELLRLDVDDDGAEALIGGGESNRRGQRPVRDRGRRRTQHGPKRARDRDERAGRGPGRIGVRRVRRAALGARRRTSLRPLPHRPSRGVERVRALGPRGRMAVRCRRGAAGAARRRRR